MYNSNDLTIQSLKILSNRDVSVIENKDEDYIFSALTVDGGISAKKGVSIGYQDKMVSGLMIYDDENFYGFSEKYGLSLLSTHPEYNQLKLPSSIFENKEERTLQPTPKNVSEHFKNLKDTEKEEIKNLNIDLQIKDFNNFYITIPDDYNSFKFTLVFNINYIYDLNSIISYINFVIINESDKSISIKILNSNCFYDSKFTDLINKKSIIKINMEVINNDYFLISSKVFEKN
jgi:hypothetical protein